MATTQPQPDTDHQQQRIQVIKPEDYNNQRRLRQIHNARENVPERRREAREHYNPNDVRNSEITEHRYHEIVANALLDYLIEVEPIMRSNPGGTDEDAHPYWNQETVVKAPDGSNLTLKDIVESGGRMPTDDDTDTDEERPLDVLRAQKAYRLVNRYLAEVGLGLELDTGGLPEQTGFDTTRAD